MLTDSQKAQLKKAEELLAEAAFHVNEVIAELDNEPGPGDPIVFDLDDAYESVSRAEVKLSNIRTQTV